MQNAESAPKKYTILDNFIINDLTKIIPKSKNQSTRKSYQCNIDKTINCNFIITSKGLAEMHRLFKHFQKLHCPMLSNFILQFMIDNPSNLDSFSSIPEINDFIDKYILPKYESEKEKSQEISKCFSKKTSSESCLDISKIDFTKLKQTVLEQGIFEHLSLRTICSKSHSSFIIGFLKLGFEIGRNSDMSLDTFLNICDDINVPRNLIEKVGDDYFNSNISIFRGSMAAFQIDASKINDKEILVFIMSAKSRSNEPFLFDLEHNFDGTLEDFHKSVRERILKAKENNIEIVGITTDNLPTQIQALSQDSTDCLQNKFIDMKTIIHFRCTCHLLNLAYTDWIKTKCFLSKYEKKIKRIMKVLNLKIFTKKLSKKIPTICITRWNSAFRALETIFHLRKEIISLFSNSSDKEMKILITIISDLKFIFSYGFFEVYPLLFHFATLIDFMQNSNISCVESIIIVEYFLDKIKQNIIKYKIRDCGKKLYSFIKKRLILNKNIQLYNLASLFHPDGIVRYRRIMSKVDPAYNIPEENDSYFHCIKDKILLEINEKNRKISIEDYKKNEYNNFFKVLNKPYSIKVHQKKKKTSIQNTSKKQLILDGYFPNDFHSKENPSDEEFDDYPLTINLLNTNEKHHEALWNNSDSNMNNTTPKEVITINNIIFELNFDQNTAKIIGNNNAKGDIFIPQKVTHNNINLDVISINERSFKNTKLIKSIKFPTDSKVETFEKDSFVDSSIESIEIPGSVKNLAEGWCRGTSKLTNLKLMPNNKRFIYLDNKMLIGKNEIESDTYENCLFVRRDIKVVTIPSFIKQIDAYAFSESLCESIYITTNVTIIKEGAFYKCIHLCNVEIPVNSKLQKIGKLCFYKTSIDKIKIPSLLELGESWCDNTTLISQIEESAQKSPISSDTEYNDDELEEDYNDENQINVLNDDLSEEEDMNDSNNFDFEQLSLSEINVDYAIDHIIDYTHINTNTENTKEINDENINDNTENTNESGENCNNNKKDDSSKNNTNKIFKKNKEKEHYDKRKKAIEWNNIENEIIKNACYLNLTKEEAINSAIELHNLIMTPFSVIRKKYPSAICANSYYSHFWSLMRKWEYDDGHTYNNIANIAARLFPIPASEVDAERAFSQIKWRFDSRRNKIKPKTMINELNIENEQKRKIQSNSDFLVTMWQHPNHKS